MAERSYDLVIIGAGSGGLIAAGFAAQLGARVALDEKSRIGGDCTWTGCVPSKALLKAAKVAHEVRTACHYGITSGPPKTDMAKVRDYVFAAIQQVYQFESPEELQQKGIDVRLGSARFISSKSIEVADRVVHSKKFLITTGARAFLPPIAGLSEVPFVTYEKIFENDRLPENLVVIGGGPIGSELAQAYKRLGSQVTVVADRLLPKEDQDVRELIGRVFEDEGIQLLKGRANSVRKDGAGIVVSTDGAEVRGDLLLVAPGRKPTVEGLGAGLVLYPLSWIGEAWVAWRLGGGLLLALFLGLLAPSGFFALSWSERLGRLYRETHALLRLLLDRDLARHLAERRREILADMEAPAGLVPEPVLSGREGPTA